MGSLRRPRWADLVAFWQRGRRGWAVRDTWEMDAYLSRVIPDMLDHLAANANGAPCKHMEDMDWTPGRCNNCTCYEEWTAKLQQIARNIRAYARWLDVGLGSNQLEVERNLRRAFAGLGKVYGSLWD